MKMFQTKYVLTTGIHEVEAELVDNRDGGEPIYASHGSCGFDRIGKDIHFTLAEAQAVADEKRLRKIESLKKSIKKLEILAFVFPRQSK